MTLVGDAWLDYWLADWLAGPAQAGMSKGLAFAILGRIDGQGRDVRTGRYYPMGVLGAALEASDRHETSAPRPALTVPAPEGTAPMKHPIAQPAPSPEYLRAFGAAAAVPAPAPVPAAPKPAPPAPAQRALPAKHTAPPVRRAPSPRPKAKPAQAAKSRKH